MTQNDVHYLMASIYDNIFDTSLVDATLAYLAEAHGIYAFFTDNNGSPVADTGGKPGPAGKTYPLDFPEDIGAFTCTAPDEATLARARPHIDFCLTVINNQLQREQELQETSDEMLQLSSQLNFLFKLAQKIIGIDDLNRCYEIILGEITGAIKADHAFIQTKGRWNEELLITHNFTKEQAVAVQDKPCFVNSPKDKTMIYTCEDGSSALFSPLKEKDGQCGFAVFLKDKSHRFFSAYEKKFVSIIENIVSPTFETLRLYDSLQDLYLNTVKALAAAIDAKDEYTHGHSFRVAKYAMTIGNRLEDINAQQLNDLEIAAYMHDLGKIGISESILGKPGKLTVEEFSEIKRHPEFTDKILQPIRLPDFIVDAAVQHHERLDGSGYPLGLAGEKISFFAKVIAVADVFDALTSKRPYRDALPVEEALQILSEGIDVKFDRAVVLAFISALKNDNVDAVLGEINMNLRFAAIQNLNQFLVELAEFIMNRA